LPYTIDKDALVDIKISLIEPPFQAPARVAWSREKKSAYDVELCLLNPDDVYVARMVEQVCHIAEYRHRVQKVESRLMSLEQAAREWISKYAAKFPKYLN